MTTVIPPIYTELSILQLKELLSVIDSSDRNCNKAIIIKFGADWCKPCQNIKELCHNYFAKLPESITCFDLNIDDNMELYIAYKAKKMVNSIPTIIAYINNTDRDKNHWYAPDLSVVGSQPVAIDNFFKVIRTL